ncbi:MAG: hypothetical protein QOE90_694 [Thermoplasmata archaeon]|jgi:hypothetical protein|nr:hypothetical protein [Thermoplasmata archaeon]
MRLPSLSPKQKAGLAVALALLLWIPQGISTDTQPVVTGHSTFYNGDTYDPCLASIAGIVRSRVMWFNDQVLVERYPGKGTFLYVTEHGAEDPRNLGYLYSDGVSYNFVDPNGAAWHVDEVYHSTSTPQPNVQVDPQEATGSAKNGDPRVNATVEIHNGDKTYYWIVELAAQPIYDQFPGSDPHSYYNFLDIVDTCKFHNSTETYDGTRIHDQSTNGPSNGHDAGAATHYHNVFNADLYLGAAPTIVPGGLSTDGANYATAWATGGDAPNSASHVQQNPQNTVGSQAPGGG